MKIFLGKGKGIASINKHNVVIRYADMWSLLFAILVMNVGIQTAQVYGRYQHQKYHWTSEWIFKISIPQRSQ